MCVFSLEWGNSLNWKKTIAFITAIALISLSACNLPTSGLASRDLVATAVAQTMSAPPGPAASATPAKNKGPELTVVPKVATATPTAAKPNLSTLPPLTHKPSVIIPVANTTCQRMTLYVDPTLASGSTCKTVPEGTGPGNSTVNTDQLTLQGYVLSGRFFTPHLDVFSVQSLQQASPSIMNTRLPALQSLINGAAPGTTELPLLPVFEAAQEFHAQYKVISFGNGSGTRYLTEYAQFYDPINNHDMFYSFQGLTSDGKYWVSALLPISNPILPVNGNNPPNGQSWDAFSKVFDAYIADITGKLNSQAGDSFSPTIPALDALISSITIQP